jgi:UrcA family protein
MNSNVKTDNRTLRIYALAMWLACTLAVSSAHAGDEVRSERVKYADLNLNAPAGVEALYGRIHAAARRVCTQPPKALVNDGCMRKAESEAVGKVNVPLLTAFYEAKTGSHPLPIIAQR